MHQRSNLVGTVTQQPSVCPLIKLGCSSSSEQPISPTAHVHIHNGDYAYHYQQKYRNRCNASATDDQLCPKDYLQKLSAESYYGSHFHQKPYSLNNEAVDYLENYEHSSSNSENYKHSPLLSPYLKPSSLDLTSLTYNKSYLEQKKSCKVEMSQPPNTTAEYHQTQKIQSTENKDLLVSFSKLGRTSPNLDPGYHTLILPSSGSLTENTWNDPNLYKGKKIQNKNNSFDKLTDELIIRIFSYLPSLDLSVCARVCRRFEILSWTPTLWRTLTIQGEHISGDKAIRGVLRQLCGQGRTGACPSVEKVHITNGAKLTDRGVMLLARRCPELTHLQIHGGTSITNSALVEIATRCHNLQHLDVTGCLQISCISVTAGPEPPRCLALQYLDLTDCPCLQDTGLRVIVRNCPQLAFLYLRRCIQITDAGLKFVPSFCSGLRELSVSDCSNITDFGLYELAKLGATLRYLSVAKCDQVSDAGLKVIAKRCYKLRYLNIRGCAAVSDDAITILARSCTRIRALDIGKCDVSDAGLRALAECCPNLKKLNLRSCDLVTDRGVQCIAYYCRGLQQLNIQDCQISLEGYRAVKKYCKRCVIEHTNPGFF